MTQHDPDPTELARPIDATEASLAWSIDESPEVVAYRPRWIARTAVAGALVLIAAAGGMAVWHVRGAEPTPVVAATPSGAPAAGTTPPVSPAQTSSTPAVTSEDRRAPAPIPPPPDAGPSFDATATAAKRQPPDFDAQFVMNLQAAGWNVWNPDDVVPHAHTVCMALRNGDTVPSINQQMVTAGLLYPREAVSFTEIVMATYPNCPN